MSEETTTTVDRDKRTDPPPARSAVPGPDAVTNVDILNAIGTFTAQLRQDMAKLEKRYAAQATSIKSMFGKAIFETNLIYNEQKRNRLSIASNEAELGRLRCMIGDMNDQIDALEKRCTELEKRPTRQGEEAGQ